MKAKITSLYLALFMFIFITTSCSSKKFEKVYNTPTFSLKVSGTKESAFDPFLLNIAVENKINFKSTNVDIQVFANDLNESNPTFVEVGKNKYSLKFMQPDETARELFISADENELTIEEIAK
jgi:hypothetical protein